MENFMDIVNQQQKLWMFGNQSIQIFYVPCTCHVFASPVRYTYVPVMNRYDKHIYLSANQRLPLLATSSYIMPILATVLTCDTCSNLLKLLFDVQIIQIGMLQLSSFFLMPWNEQIGTMLAYSIICNNYTYA